MAKVPLFGLLNRRYDLDLANLNAPWNDVGGIYVFIRWDGRQLTVVRVGKCVSFQKRPMPPAHPCWLEAFRDHGATHVLALAIHDEKTRAGAEQDLIAAYNPPMNVQLRTGPVGIAAFPQLPGALGLGIINRGKTR